MILFYVGLSNKLFTKLEVRHVWQFVLGMQYLPYVVHQLVI